MSSPIEPGLFDFVDEFARAVEDGDRHSIETLAASSGIITFCESFFVQFFANVLDYEIEGFDSSAKRAAAGLGVKLPKTKKNAPVRALVGLFEKFCDMYADVRGGAYGSAAEITYRRFHEQYMSRLLKRAEAWAKAGGDDDLAQRIKSSREHYEEAVKSQKW